MLKLHDAYLSVAEALDHAGYERDTFVKIHWIDSEKITKENVNEVLKDLVELLSREGLEIAA